MIILAARLFMCDMRIDYPIYLGKEHSGNSNGVLTNTYPISDAWYSDPVSLH